LDKSGLGRPELSNTARELPPTRGDAGGFVPDQSWMDRVLTSHEPDDTPARRAWWTPRRLALAGIGIELLALARMLFELAPIRSPDGSLPPTNIARHWLLAAFFAAFFAIASTLALWLGRPRLSVGLAAGCVLLLVVYMKVMLT
jgi:hypothetical protein